MSDKSKPPVPKAKRKEGEQFTVYPSIKGGIEGVLRDKATTKLYPIGDFYKANLVAKALDELPVADRVEYITAQGNKRHIDTKAIKQKLVDNVDKLQAFYDKQKQKPLAVTTYKLINDEALPKLDKYFTLETIQPNQWLPKTATITRDINGASTAGRVVDVDQVPDLKNAYKQPITGYLITDKNGLATALANLQPTDYREHKDVEIMASVEGNTIEGLKSLFTDLIDLTNACGITDDSGQVMSIGKVVINQIHLEFLSIISRTLAGVLDRNKPVEQTNLFSNMTVGVDTAEITGRHQFFSPMFRGFMGLGESGLYEAINIANRRNSNVTIPYETKGSSSVYKTKLQTSVDINGVEKALITDEAKAQRFTARLIKAQGILYLWAMHTNSLTIYNTKVTDMLRLAGYEGRIKPEHYIDITEGIAGLFAIAVTKTNDHYTDPKTGKKIYVGKNEMYGEVVRPIGEVRAIWHMQDKPYYYTEAEFNNLDEITRKNLDYKGEVKQEYTEVDKNGKRQNKTRRVNKYYRILTTNKSNNDKTTEAIEYEKQPAYIKQLIRLEIAKGMLNPTAKRATLVSKALLRLNTLQERQYLQLGSFISDLFSQYQDKTIQGEPVALTLQTLLEYRGLTDPDSLRRVEQTKTYLKQALDKLVDIGHIAKWTVKNGSYEKLTLTGKDLDTVILIYPTTSIQEALKPVINDDDKALTTILTQEVRADGLATTAEHYGADTEVIEAVINNRDTADSLPNKAYNELKTKAYDKGKASKKKRVN